MPRVIVGMSGGVDSSVSAYLLKEQSCDIEAVFIKSWDEDDGGPLCTAKTDYADAKLICKKLGIKLHMINFAGEYWDEVFENFLMEYKKGRTPNPDILCNRYIKFGHFLKYAKQLGADYIATGHYARICKVSGVNKLFKGLDANKDQSYFLYAVRAEVFNKVLFPLGELEKPKVREIARKLGLHNANKKDSTGICFIGERKFNDFIKRFLPDNKGLIKDVFGKPIGEHTGLMQYTLGQRKGIGIGGRAGNFRGNSDNEPWFVVAKDLLNNTLIVAQGAKHPALFKTRLKAGKLNWIADEPKLGSQYLAKIRYRARDECCVVSQIDKSAIILEFAKPQMAITPGQSVVIYNSDNSGECLGGGIIED